MSGNGSKKEKDNDNKDENNANGDGLEKDKSSKSKEKVYRCEIRSCGAQYNQQSSVVDHQNYYHRGVRWTCETCSMICGRKKVFYGHRPKCGKKDSPYLIIFNDDRTNLDDSDGKHFLRDFRENEWRQYVRLGQARRMPKWLAKLKDVKSSSCRPTASTSVQPRTSSATVTAQPRVSVKASTSNTSSANLNVQSVALVKILDAQPNDSSNTYADFKKGLLKANALGESVNESKEITGS